MNNSENLIYTKFKEIKDNSGFPVIDPLFCDVLISEKCNLRCQKCYFWKHGVEGEVAIGEYKSFIASLKDFKNVPLEINLGGGEPLLNNEIFDLIRFCSHHGIPPAISTNGTLIDEEMARKVSDSGLSRLSVSLESLKEDIHDFIVGTVGAHRRLMRSIKHLKKYWKNGTLNVHTLLLEQNMDGIKELVEWVNEDHFFAGIAFQALAQPFRTNIIERWYLDDKYSLLWPKDAYRAVSVINMLIDYKRLGYRIVNPVGQLIIYKRYYENPESFVRAVRCNFGEYIFNVNVLGFVHLCCFMPPIGNIRESSIKDIWYSEEAVRTRQAMYNCRRSCNNIVNCYFQDEGEGGVTS